MPTHAETPPRWATGTRSGTAAVSVASIVLKQACAATQPTSTPTTVCWWDRTTSATAPSIAPPNVHTCRRPSARPANHSDVRSDSAPASGFTTMAAAAPNPVTQPSIVSLWAWSIASICCGSSTWIGVKNAIHTPSWASTSRATQRPRTGTVGSARAAGRATPASAGPMAVGRGGSASAVTARTA